MFDALSPSVPAKPEVEKSEEDDGIIDLDEILDQEKKDK